MADPQEVAQKNIITGRPAVRVVGSGFTVLKFDKKAIAYLDSFTNNGQPPIQGRGAGYEAITPLGSRHPIEIVTGRVLGMGSLNLTINELWDGPIWTQLMRMSADQRNIVNVWDALDAYAASTGTELTCDMIIKPPAASKQPIRGLTFMGCKVIDIDDSETVAIRTLSVAKRIEIGYTHSVPYTVNT